MDFTTWYLEQTDRPVLTAVPPLGNDVNVRRSGIPSPEFSRFLYTAVGGDWYWRGRLPWTYQQWSGWLGTPGLETWVLYLQDTPAGYAEIHAQTGGDTEIRSFGLLPAFTGRGLGRYFLARAVDEAWDIASRWPDREATRRVWLHTCSLDGPHALANYLARGFTVYDIKQGSEDLPPRPPGPWPGAQRAVD